MPTISEELEARIEELERGIGRYRILAIATWAGITPVLLVATLLSVTFGIIHHRAFRENAAAADANREGVRQTRVAIEENRQSVSQNGVAIERNREAVAENRTTTELNRVQVQENSTRIQSLPTTQSNEAQRFTLVDANKKEHGFFGFNDEGLPCLWLYDANGTERVGLGLSALAEPNVILKDAAGNVRTQLVVRSNGLPSFTLLDEDAKGFIRLALDKETLGLQIADDTEHTRLALTTYRHARERAVAAPGLRINDEYGNERVGLGLRPDGPVLHFFDEAEKVRASLTAVFGSLGLRLYDENGQSRAEFSLGGGPPMLWLTDRFGQLRAALSLAEDGSPQLRFKNRDGTSTWSAP